MARLGPAEIFDGEAEGARQGLQHACYIDSTDQIHLYIDNTTVVQELLGDAHKVIATGRVQEH